MDIDQLLLVWDSINHNQFYYGFLNVLYIIKDPVLSRGSDGAVNISFVRLGYFHLGAVVYYNNPTRSSYKLDTINDCLYMRVDNEIISLFNTRFLLESNIKEWPSIKEE